MTSTKHLVTNNIVSKDIMRGVQSNTLRQLSEILQHSFGPNGSNACIKKEGAYSRYTKDGHTIIGAIQYNGVIEQSIKDDIESITRHIVKTVGDGTTSAVILASIIFDEIVKFEKDHPKMPPVKIISTMQRAIDGIVAEIEKSATPITMQDVYDIAMISTNGNKMIADVLVDIYKEFGFGVYIDVTPAPETSEDIVTKSYNGMTINSGYCDSCYVTNKQNNTAEVDHPQVYFFEHPIDTPELGVYLDSIISNNIIAPVNAGNYKSIVPTVIFAPMISQDCSSTMDSLVANMASMPTSNKLPICIITKYTDVEELHDLATMCGAKLIRKYIDPKTYQADVKAGKAPTPETIFKWAGTCDKVVAHSDKTVFVRPSKMYDENGDYSTIYQNLLNFLEVEVDRATKDGENIHDTAKLKRRLHSLKANMVEMFVGGITQADRDSLRDLVEDAVLNIRSASSYGVGFGANMSAACAIDRVITAPGDKDAQVDEFQKIISMAYRNLCCKLFGCNPDTYSHMVDICKSDGLVFNIAEDKFENNVKSSIKSDVTILETVGKIISIMATCNQFLVPSASHNIYEDFTSKD